MTFHVDEVVILLCVLNKLQPDIFCLNLVNLAVFVGYNYMLFAANFMDADLRLCQLAVSSEEEFSKCTQDTPHMS